MEVEELLLFDGRGITNRTTILGLSRALVILVSVEVATSDRDFDLGFLAHGW
jgi:hypothetical protein